VTTARGQSVEGPVLRRRLPQGPFSLGHQGGSHTKGFLLLLLALAALALPALASAHPLGNFTINRYSRVELSGDRAYVLYVLDMAEIPTFQAEPQVEAKGRKAYARALAAQIGRRLSLRVGGRQLELHPLRQALAFPPGQAGLRTTRLEIVYGSAPIGSGTLTLAYRDENFRDRIGWKEIVVRADSGAQVRSASVPSTSSSAELRAYPKSLLQSPLDVTEATATVVPGSGPGIVPATLSGKALGARVAVRNVSDGGFPSLIAHDRLSVGFAFVSVLVAMFWGAAHAFSPGHGKSIIAAYLVGSRGTPRHAVLLGVTVTVTHTIGVFALGLVTLSLSEFVVPEDVYPWLNLVSALLIVGVGMSVLRWRLREWRAPRGARGHDHGHDHHAHDHHHHHHDHEEPDRALSLHRLLGVGISGGIIPCPTALVVLLAAISLHRVGYGLVLILAFSFGLAAAMTGIGILAVTAKRIFSRVDLEGDLVRVLPAVSALVVLGLGIAMTVRALPKVS
jgi:nickel/cobalt transporter (NicO) family protein